MSEENLEEWDASFLEELIQVEELALSCSYVNQNNPTSSSLPPPSPSPSHQQPLHFPPLPSRTDSISYSPPRELSQRPTDLGGASNSSAFTAKCATPSTPVRRSASSAKAKDLEIELLKKELGRVSKQLADLEHECSKLKKERSKENQHTVSNSNNEAKVANLEDICFNNREHGVPVAAHDGFVQEFPNRKSFNDQIGLHKVVKSSCQEIGVQTDLNASLDLSEKLQDIWGLPIKSSVDMALKSSSHPFLSAEAAKASCFYSALAKISSGMLQLQALFESLFDLCTVENVVIMYRSLHILHVLLKHLLTFERESRGSALYSGKTS
ncbi:hypothetical protein V6N12_043998 [Hibiscus sabdariffa]|uniref:Uncharacterized protein n=1 Tax=Hibiscus sabdariffa TaxID=183260 RepID=A0ABR2DG35_9ROSI